MPNRGCALIGGSLPFAKSKEESRACILYAVSLPIMKDALNCSRAKTGHHAPQAAVEKRAEPSAFSFARNRAVRTRAQIPR
jgi:hypothetical protein